MALKIGDIVEQQHQGCCRLGVLYKKKDDPNAQSAIIPWTYFEVLWVTGERSVERVDHISLTSDLMSKFNDLVVLRDLQDSIKAGASYE